MAGEKPLIRMNVVLGAQVPAPPRPTSRREFHDLVKQQHAPAGDRRRAYVHLGGRKAFAKAFHHPALGKCGNLRCAKAGTFTRYGRRVHPRILQVFGSMRIPDHAVRVRQFLVAKEARLALAHGENALVAAVAVVMEEEEAHRSLLSVAVQVNFVVQRVAHHRQGGVERSFAAQQPVDALTLVDKIGAQIRNQQQVSLPCLDQDARRHMPGVQIPGIRQDVGFGPDHALLAHGPRCGVDPQHAICQQQRRHRHPHLAHEVILARKDGAQYL